MPAALRVSGCKGCCDVSRSRTHNNCHFERSEKSPAIDGRFLAALEMTALFGAGLFRLCAFMNLQTPICPQTRRAAGMDARRFPTEPWMASRKIPRRLVLRVCFVGEALFFGSFLLALSKRNEPGRRRRTEAVAFRAGSEADSEDQKHPHPNPPPPAGEGARPTAPASNCACKPRNGQTRRKTSVPFVPPNPNEFDNAMSTFASRATCAT